MPEQRIPRADSAFAAYADHYYAAVEAFYAERGLDPVGLTELKKALDIWNAAYPNHTAARDLAEGARLTKDAAKRELERQIRPVTAFVQSFPTTTDADRATIGITIKAPGAARAPAPASRPLLTVESGSRLVHRLRVLDEGAGRRAQRGSPRTARPRGTLGAEVYCAMVGPRATPPADVKAYTFVRTVTGGSAEVTFEAERGGQTAAYLVRWVSATGEPGPWSETVTATVAA